MTDEVTVVTHIAGLEVTINDRYLRQLCGWCGYELIDYDLTAIAMATSEDEPNPKPTVWPAGRLIRIEGNLTTVLERDTPLPNDGCMASVWLRPEDIAPDPDADL